MIPRKQFELWLRHQIFVDIDAGKCYKFAVKHVNSASKAGHAILNIDVPHVDGPPTDDWIADQIKLIEDITTADAAGAGGTQAYVVFSFHGEDAEKPTSRFSLRMAGDPSLEDADIESEPATKTGVLAQLMRHNEAIMRTSALQTSTVMTLMQRTTQQQAAIIEKLVEEKFNNIGTVEALLSQKNERDIEIMKASRDMEMKEKAFDTLKMLAPTVMNKLLTSGNPQNVATPQAISARDQQLAALADSMTTEQLEALQKVFNTEQLMTFIDVFSQIKKQQEVVAAQKASEK